jgi:uroporphyrin-III C-methyltransferase/precorrin-2 dehydrogenase/sirohydrochlorin ferrochelatase
MRSLPIFLGLQGRPAMLIGEGEAADAKRRLLERAGARIVQEADEAALAIVALDEPDAVVARLKARGILVNAVDRPDLCDFTLPAILDRDPVLIAIGTGGASAGLAKALRQRLELLVPADLGRLAEALHAARGAIRKRWPDAADRRRAVDRALAEHGPLDPLCLRSSRAKSRDVAWAERVSTALDTIGGEPVRSKTDVVRIRLRTPDPDDLTLREARLLGLADRLYHRSDIPAAILDRARADAVRIVCETLPETIPEGLSIDLDWAGR